MKRGKLLTGVYAKPQNKLSALVREKSKNQIAAWLKNFGLVEYHANLLAGELLSKAISARLDATHPTAPDVLLSDADKIESLVMSAKKIADALDKEEKLEALLGELEDADNPLDI